MRKQAAGLSKEGLADDLYLDARSLVVGLDCVTAVGE
jgi:hypothetical protein